jgi:hypothetical protein
MLQASKPAQRQVHASHWLVACVPVPLGLLQVVERPSGRRSEVSDGHQNGEPISARGNGLLVGSGRQQRSGPEYEAFLREPHFGVDRSR